MSYFNHQYSTTYKQLSFIVVGNRSRIHRNPRQFTWFSFIHNNESQSQSFRNSLTHRYFRHNLVWIAWSSPLDSLQYTWNLTHIIIKWLTYRGYYMPARGYELRYIFECKSVEGDSVWNETGFYNIRFVLVAWIPSSDWIKLRVSYVILESYVTCCKTQLPWSVKTRNMYRSCGKRWRTLFFLQQLFGNCLPV